MNISRLVSVLCVLNLSFLGLRGQSTDTIPLVNKEIPNPINKNIPFTYGEYDFNAKQLILPTTLITVGALGTFIGPYKKFNRFVRDKVYDLKGNHKIKIDDYVQYLPTATHLLLGFTDVPHKNSFLQRLSIDVTSAISLTILTNVFKSSFREKRPYSGIRNSFPSGHTATAFMGAELMRIEYGPYWGLGGYCVATTVGLLRIYNGRHWVNDVIAGAGIGILSARIGYWMLPYYNKWFFKKFNVKDNNTQTLSFSALPSYSYYNSSFTINFMLTF